MRLIFDVKTQSKTYDTTYVQTVDLNNQKKNLIEALQQLVKSHIETYYPEIKQRSDLADKEYFENYLKLYSVDEVQFRQLLSQAVVNIYDNGSDFATELNNLKSLIPIPSGIDVNKWNMTLEQLLKVAIRVDFVQRNKSIYYQVKQQIENATTQAELPDLSTITFVNLPI